MGRRGPAPTPSKTLEARGSWRGKANRAEPVPPPGDVAPPAWLTPAALEVWTQLAGTLRSMGLLTTIDAATLGRYCDATVRWRKAAAFLEEKGDFYPIKDAAGQVKCLMPFPQVAMYHKLGATLLRLEQEFGLTPSSRSRVHVPDQAKPQDDGKARFFPRAAG